MTEMFGEAWSPMSVPDLAPDDDDDDEVEEMHLKSLFQGLNVDLAQPGLEPGTF